MGAAFRNDRLYGDGGGGQGDGLMTAGKGDEMMGGILCGGVASLGFLRWRGSARGHGDGTRDQGQGGNKYCAEPHHGLSNSS